MLEGSATKLYWVEQQWRTDLAHMICRGWQTLCGTELLSISGNLFIKLSCSAFARGMAGVPLPWERGIERSLGMEGVS